MNTTKTPADVPDAHDLSAEAWREYDFGDRTYRIDNPTKLFCRPGGTTHRVLDAQGMVHCCPAPGTNGCVLRWLPKDATQPVQF
jgi:hypothetical protein